MSEFKDRVNAILKQRKKTPEELAVDFPIWWLMQPKGTQQECQKCHYVGTLLDDGACPRCFTIT